MILKKSLKLISYALVLSIILFVWTYFKPIRAFRILNIDTYDINEVENLEIIIGKKEIDIELNSSNYKPYYLTKSEKVDFFNALSDFTVRKTQKKDFVELNNNEATYYTLTIIDNVDKRVILNVIISDHYFNFYEHKTYIHNNENLMKFLEKLPIIDEDTQTKK